MAESGGSSTQPRARAPPSGARVSGLCLLHRVHHMSTRMLLMLCRPDRSFRQWVGNRHNTNRRIGGWADVRMSASVFLLLGSSHPHNRLSAQPQIWYIVVLKRFEAGFPRDEGTIFVLSLTSVLTWGQYRPLQNEYLCTKVQRSFQREQQQQQRASLFLDLLSFSQVRWPVLFQASQNGCSTSMARSAPTVA